MKKLLTLLLALAMVFCFASCEYLPDSFQSAMDSIADKVAGVGENLPDSFQSAMDSIADKVAGVGENLPDSLQSAIDGVMGMLGLETTCKHDWTDATCTAPKTCSLCGATDGEAKMATQKKLFRAQLLLVPKQV